MTPEEVKQQAMAILKDIIQFWQPMHGEAILKEFANRLQKV